MSVAYIHCQFYRVVPGIATLQCGFTINRRWGPGKVTRKVYLLLTKQLRMGRQMFARPLLLFRAEPGTGADSLQRPLVPRSRFQARLTASVRAHITRQLGSLLKPMNLCPVL